MNKKLELPKVGARIQKTALSVFICMIIPHLLNMEYPFYACIAAVICLKDSHENTIKMGVNRMIGTLIGGCAGILSTFLFLKFNNYYFECIVTSLLCIVVIYICKVLKKPGSVTIACIVLLANTLLIKQEPNYIYTINRIIETFIGIIVATLVNRFIFPYKKDEK